MRLFYLWLRHKWTGMPDPKITDAYRLTFNTAEGRRVLNHLLDSVYCQVIHTTDPVALATHNGRRSIIQEILENIDYGERPHKTQIAVEMGVGDG